MEHILLLAPVAEEGESFVPLLIVIGLAFIVPFIVARINRWIAIPVVVGEILLGIVLGQFYPELRDDRILIIMSEFGFGILFFLAGTEIDFSNLRSSRPQKTANWSEYLASPVPMGIVMFGLTLLIGVAISFGLAQTTLLQGNSWLFLVLIFAPSSLGLIVAVLKESGYGSTQLGQTLLVAATVADFGTLLILTVVVAVIDLGGFGFEVGLVGLILVGFAVVYWIVRRIYGQEWVRQLVTRINTTSSQVKLRFALFIFLIFVVLSEFLGAEIVLGTFLAGVLVSLVAGTEDKATIHQIESIGFGFFIPIFFIMIGVRFDLQALIDSPDALLLVPALILGSLAVKIIPGLLLRLKFSWHDTFAGGMLLTARLSLIVAEAAIGVELGILTEPVNADIILLAMIMATVGPLVFNYMMPKPEMAEEPPILVIGANKMGLEVAQQLQRHHEPVLLIDPNPEHIAQAQELGLAIVAGYADRPDVHTKAILERATRMVVTPGESDVNYQICRFIKTTYGARHIVAHVTDPREFGRFQQLGVTPTNPAVDYAALLVLLTRSPGAYELMTRTDDAKEVHEVVVRNPSITGKRLRELRLPSGVFVMAVRRDGELLVPNADTRMELGDFVTVVGPIESVDQSYYIFTADAQDVSGVEAT
ncbi:MAG: monovalent cation:proton antiporter family protein [Anaerolineae bacterium]|nr:monovalent cation:proton antiporter family protein [Anaerolineae bacterium]